MIIPSPQPTERLATVEYIAPVEYDQLWRHDERLKDTMPAVLRPTGPDGSTVELCHASSSSKLYRAVKGAGKPLVPTIQEHTAALDGLKLAKSYLESADALDTAVRTERIIAEMNQIRINAIEDRVYEMNTALQRHGGLWVVFKAGAIGCFYAGQLARIEAVGDELDPISVPLLSGIDDVPGRLPPEAQQFALYRTAIDDVSQDRPESRSV